MANQFKFVGISRHPSGELAVRYANDGSRTRVLTKNGHTEVQFIELEQPEHKMDCVDALMDWAEQNVDQLDGEVLAVIAAEAELMGFDLSRC